MDQKVIQDRINQLYGATSEAYQKANELSGGLLEILADAVRRFSQARATEGAASIAYYTLFSLFPLLLAVIALGSLFLESARIQLEVIRLLSLVLPVRPDVVVGNIEEVMRERGTIGIVGATGLVWAASAMFMTLFRNINRAWPQAEPLHTLKSRLAAVFMVFGLGLVLLLTLVTSAVLNLLPQLIPPFARETLVFESFQWIILSNLLPWAVTFVVFLGLYRLIPNTSVRWSEAFWGALVASTGWEITTRLFTWILGSGLVQYRLVYGSLGALVALLFWVYLNSLIVIFGAHLCATIAYKTRYISQ